MTNNNLPIDYYTVLDNNDTLQLLYEQVIYILDNINNKFNEINNFINNTFIIEYNKISNNKLKQFNRDDYDQIKFSRSGIIKITNLLLPHIIIMQNLYYSNYSITINNNYTEIAKNNDNKSKCYNEINKFKLTKPTEPVNLIPYNELLTILESLNTYNYYKLKDNILTYQLEINHDEVLDNNKLLSANDLILFIKTLMPSLKFHIFEYDKKYIDSIIKIQNKCLKNQISGGNKIIMNIILMAY